MKINLHQLAGILGLEKEITEYYQDHSGFYIKLEGNDTWKKIQLSIEEYKSKPDPNGGYKMEKVK